MDVEQIGQMGKMLKRYLNEFSECFGRRECAEHTRTYVSSQLSNLPRKSVEPMADQAGIDPRALQKFLAERKWDDELMVKQVHQIIARDHAHPHSIGIIDETSFPKKGTKTPGVQRQHCGATGKQDNCTITVHLGYATPEFHCLLSSALFLPEGWSVDRVRCREAGIPDGLQHRPKWQIALELHQQAREHGVWTQWLTADEHYGRPVEFHLELSRRKQLYIVEVPANFWGWCQKPKVVIGRRGPYRKETPPISTVEDLVKHSNKFTAQEWERFYIKDGTKGPIIWEAKSAKIYLKDGDDLPTEAFWLIVTRNTLNQEEVKYFVSNASQESSLQELLYVAFSRWHLERCFEDKKTELGMDHFEVRTYAAMMRHLALTSVSFLFVARIHNALKKNAKLNSMPGTNGGQRIPECTRQTWSETLGVSGSCRHDNHPYPGTECELSQEPSKENPQALESVRNPDFEVASM